MDSMDAFFHAVMIVIPLLGIMYVLVDILHVLEKLV